MDYGALHLTAKKTQIPSVSKQSKFEGSDREVRGRIVKQLVGGQNPPRPPLQKGVVIADIKAEFPRKDVEAIVQGLVDEGIVEMEGEMVRILE